MSVSIDLFNIKKIHRFATDDTHFGLLCNSFQLARRREDAYIVPFGEDQTTVCHAEVVICPSLFQLIGTDHLMFCPVINKEVKSVHEQIMKLLIFFKIMIVFSFKWFFE